MSNIFGKTWNIYTGQAPNSADLPTVGATISFQAGNPITVRASSNINRPGSRIDWNTLTLNQGTQPDGYTGSVQLSGAATPVSLGFVPGGGRNGKDGIDCVFTDNSGSLSSARVGGGDGDGEWKADD
jgi:hypothetical protein